MARCPVFLSYDAIKRSQVVRDRKHCSNCLSHSHTASNCQSAFNCRKCNERHHTFLHREVAPTRSSTPVVTPASPPAAPTAATTTEVSSSVASSIIPATLGPSEIADTPSILLTTLKTAIVDVVEDLVFVRHEQHLIQDPQSR